MINIGANGNKIAYGIKHFNVDEFKELEGVNVYNLKPGSTAFIIHTSKMYMLDSDYKWIETTLATGGGSGSGGSGGGNDSDNDGDLDNGETSTPEYDGGSIDGTDPDDSEGNYNGGSIDNTDPEAYDAGSIDGTDPT